MTLAPDEFIRRFLLHVLPKGFHRIRHYGLLGSAAMLPRRGSSRLSRLTINLFASGRRRADSLRRRERFPVLLAPLPSTGSEPGAAPPACRAHLVSVGSPSPAGAG